MFISVVADGSVLSVSVGGGVRVGGGVNVNFGSGHCHVVVLSGADVT